MMAESYYDVAAILRSFSLLSDPGLQLLIDSSRNFILR